MRTLNKAILSALVIGLAPAAGADPVSLTYAPKPGTMWKVTDNRTKTTTQDGKSSAQVATTVGTLKVVSGDADGYVMEWTTASVTAGGMVVEGVQPDLLIGIPIRFKADEDGIPATIVDGDKLIARVTDTLGKVASSKAASDAVVKLFSTTSPDIMARILLVDASAIGNCHNFNLEVGKLQTEKSPTVGLGGTTIEATYTALLDDAGSAVKPAHIRLTQEIGNGQLGKMMNSIAAGSPNQPSAKDQAAIASMSRVTTTDCYVNRKTGEAASVVVDLVVQGGANKAEDKRDIRIERLP